jgi:hypothetical protein
MDIDEEISSPNNTPTPLAPNIRGLQKSIQLTSPSPTRQSDARRHHLNRPTIPTRNDLTFHENPTLDSKDCRNRNFSLEADRESCMVLQPPRTRDLNQINTHGFLDRIPKPTELNRGQPVCQNSPNPDSDNNPTRDGFHERLAQKGIVFTVAEIAKEPPEISYHSDSSTADDESESDWDTEMDKEPTSLPEYQQNVRDVLYEITEVYSILEIY